MQGIEIGTELVAERAGIVDAHRQDHGPAVARLALVGEADLGQDHLGLDRLGGQHDDQAVAGVDLPGDFLRLH